MKFGRTPLLRILHFNAQRKRHDQMRPTRQLRWTALLLVVALAGCATRGNVDLLENRLRQQEDDLFALESQLDSTRGELTVARREADAFRKQLARRGDRTILPEQASALFRTTGIRIDKMTTGGLDRDGSTGDDLLVARLVPHDSGGDSVKLPGEIQLELFDLAAGSKRQRIGAWNFTSEESLKYWYRGLGWAGYLFKLPWQSAPRHKNLILHARLKTADGRVFDASEKIEIALPPSTKRWSKRQSTRGTKAASTGQRQPALFQQTGHEAQMEPFGDSEVWNLDKRGEKPSVRHVSHQSDPPRTEKMDVPLFHLTLTPESKLGHAKAGRDERPFIE